METILQGLLELGGVNAAMVLDGSGKLLAHRGKAIYDRALCEQVGGGLSRAVDSMQLQHEDWESASASYSDGTLLLRRLDSTVAGPCFLALVADATLNPAFATVAIRVSTQKLKRVLDGAGSGSSVGPASASAMGSLPGFPGSGAGAGGSQVGPAHPAAGSRPVLASSSGLSWSRASGSSVSGSGISGVTAADAASSAFLTHCARELARHVGPMSKLYVQEAVRRVCQDVPFSLAASNALGNDLLQHIEGEKDRQAFLASLKKPAAKK
jgi:hypothetical protein